MQLATKEATGVWRLADGWKVFLVQRGEDIDARSRLRALVGDEASRELPVGFLAWWLLAPLQGEVRDYRRDDTGESWVLADQDSLTAVRRTKERQWHLSRRTDTAHGSQRESISAQAIGCVPASYTNETTHLEVTVVCESEEDLKMDSTAFEDPDLWESSR